jgi:hypothetical protein
MSPAGFCGSDVLTGPTKNKSSTSGVFFAAHVHGILHHTFTTILYVSTTQNTTLCTPDLPKTPSKTRIPDAKKNIGAKN